VGAVELDEEAGECVERWAVPGGHGRNGRHRAPAEARRLFAAADHAVQVALARVSRAHVCGTAHVLRRGLDAPVACCSAESLVTGPYE
jgi:hypothetical protein